MDYRLVLIVRGKPAAGCNIVTYVKYVNASNPLYAAVDSWHCLYPGRAIVYTQDVGPR